MSTQAVDAAVTRVSTAPLGMMNLGRETRVAPEQDPRPSSHDSFTDTEADQARRRFRRNDPARSATRRVILVSPLTLLFCLATASAVLNWNKFQSLKYEFGWTTRSCLIVSKRVVKDPTLNSTALQSDQGGGYRGEVDVRGYGLANSSEVVTALLRADEAYVDSESYVRVMLDDLAVGKNLVVLLYSSLLIGASKDPCGDSVLNCLAALRANMLTMSFTF
jgi:hypothetical protein